jgi:sugar/nucleoside kinase (ribokinase family)
VDEDGERTVFWQRDPALRLAPGDLLEDVVAGARLLHVDNVDEEAAIVAARMARQAGRHVTTDIDRVTPATADLVAAATIPIMAEHVPQALTGEADPARALRALRQRHEGVLCVTLGAGGAMLLAGDALYHEPGLRVEVVDTTGAGDVFRGAFIAALLRGDAPPDILRFANAAAALSCTRRGAMGQVFRSTNPSGGTVSEID